MSVRLVVASRRVEEAALVAAFALSALLPLIEALGRPLGGVHIPGTAAYLQQLTIWLTFLGGLYAVREGKHLTLSTVELLGGAPRFKRVATVLAYGVAAIVVAVLAYGAWQVVMATRAQGDLLAAGVPRWVSELVMPVALALMALRFAWRASPRWRGKTAALLGVAAAFALGLLPPPTRPLQWLLLGVILVAALLGAPVFVAMAGVALVLFFKDSTPVAAVPAEIYRLIASPTLPAIPLLTACGYVLAESKAATRLVRFFRALFGWMPGGIAVLVAGVCALFTTFTGGSG